jgi:hypothetical protein
MPAYDDRLFSPAAPVVHVKLRQTQGGKIHSEIPMLMDSGADVTLIPEEAVDSLQLERSNARFELIAFDGATSESEAVHGDLVFLGRIFRGRFLVTDQEVGFLGRDILNHVCVLLDGPNLQWEELQSVKEIG